MAHPHVFWILMVKGYKSTIKVCPDWLTIFLIAGIIQIFRKRVGQLHQPKRFPYVKWELESQTYTGCILDFGHEKKCSSYEIHDDETSLSSQTFAKKLLGNLQFQKIGWKISPIGFNFNFIPTNKWLKFQCFNSSRWWFQIFFIFNPCLGRWSNLTVAYFSNGLVQPPPSHVIGCSVDVFCEAKCSRETPVPELMALMWMLWARRNGGWNTRVAWCGCF